MKLIYKILLLIIMAPNVVLAMTLTTNGVVSTLNQDFIAKTIQDYKYKLPVVYDPVMSLIGIFSPDNSNLVFEYLLDKEIIVNNINVYNLENKKTPIKNIDEYLKSKSVLEDFVKNKKNGHLSKCTMKFQGQNIFEEHLNIIFRYYMDTEFYVEFYLNTNECNKYTN